MGNKFARASGFARAKVSVGNGTRPFLALTWATYKPGYVFYHLYR